MSIAPAIWLPKEIVKRIVASPRPTDDLVTVTDFGGGFGFPSGHMTGAVAVFGILAIILFVRMGPGRARQIWPAALAALLILASFDRVTSGAHWPTDVLGSLLLRRHLAQRAHRLLPRPPPRSDRPAGLVARALDPSAPLHTPARCRPHRGLHRQHRLP